MGDFFNIKAETIGYEFSNGVFRGWGGVASNPNLIPLNPPSQGGLPIRFPAFKANLVGV